jgi:hypothetical protein
MEYGSQAIHVAPLVGLVAGQSLRTGIVGAPLRLDRWVGLLFREAFKGEADQLDECPRPSRIPEDSLGREIPVYPPGRVRRMQSGGRLAEDVQGLPLRQRTPPCERLREQLTPD